MFLLNPIALALSQPSIMLALTQHNPKVCVEADDLQGLSTMYPDCQTPVTDPICIKQTHWLGWVRLFVWVAFPVTIILIFCGSVGACVTNNQVRRLKSARRREAAQQETISIQSEELNQEKIKIENLKKKYRRGSSLFGFSRREQRTPKTPNAV